ncbi:MAG: hypothetical protein E6Q43_05400 [Dokdonella sp.]|nr:MAG: hypothetical protein EYC71_13210 [Gammaproteobacteria bacterium]TXI73451.1 MAG: hypothetical protein E6Q43_05400 [Dokdonella sp.]
MIIVPISQLRDKRIAPQTRALRRHALTSAALALFIVLFVRATPAFGADEKWQDRMVELKIEHQGEVIRIELANRTEVGYEAVLPMLLSPSGDVSGLEYQFVDSRGERAILCGLVNPISAPKPTIVKPGIVYLEIERIDFLARIYCLSSDEYRLRVVFHNVWNGKEISAPLISNELRIRPGGQTTTPAPAKTTRD